MEFKAGDRVRLQQEARVALQSGVEPGTEGTVGVDDGQNARTVIEGQPRERLITVKFDGFDSVDLVEESALEAV